MTLGEKIRKYRILHKKTQQLLGEEVGFKKSTADVRINQYETNKMSPKADIRSAIAEALDIDIEAISDINISSDEEIIHILFEYEDELGIEIEKRDGKTYIVIDDDRPYHEDLYSYLNIWKDQKSSMIPKHETVSTTQIENYNLWKSRFVKNVKEYYQAKESEINVLYDELKANMSASVPYFKTTGELAVLVTDMIKAGLSISTKHCISPVDTMDNGFTFIVNELLSPNNKAKHHFAHFLSEFEHYKALGAYCYTDFQMKDKNLKITYFIRVTSFFEATSLVENFLSFTKEANDMNELSIDAFKRFFDFKARQSSIIVDEIINNKKIQ